MKIKRQLYCLTDKHNKPDYRFLFESEQMAQHRLSQLKNSTQGETIFFSHSRRDFFANGVQRKFVSPKKKIDLRKGCWTSMKIKKVNLVDNIKPERIFKKTKKNPSLKSEYSYQTTKQLASLNIPSNNINQLPGKIFRDNFWKIGKINWHNSFIFTKSFAVTFGSLLIFTVGILSSVHYSTNKKVLAQLETTKTEKINELVSNKTKVLGAQKENLTEKEEEMDTFVLSTLEKFKKIKTDKLETEIRKMVAGSPMEKMAPLIAKEDRTVAAFLVGIAKKESNFGRRVPVLNGQDCFNYWGYRGIRKRMGTGGHTCFDSPEDAIKTVGKRINNLVKAKVDTPSEMVLWKCGSACSKDANAQKWINDVSRYFSKINNAS